MIKNLMLKCTLFLDFISIYMVYLGVVYAFNRVIICYRETFAQFDAALPGQQCYVITKRYLFMYYE
jgi:hypothetical protein